jgi:bifunctional non-homologous end joining protein LigD
MRVAKKSGRGAAEDVARVTPPPQWIPPQLTKLVTNIPAGDEWAHEIKFDGFRCTHGSKAAPSPC